MSRLPSLGSRGEGWVALQAGLLFLIAVGGRFGPSISIADPTLASALVGAGWLLVAAAGALLVSSIALLSNARSFTVMPRPIETGSLVESGPYAFIRHPVYSALVLGGLGLTLVRLSWPTLILTVALLVVLDA
ncbi:MAG TPA: methyltransferase, partial [Gaiellaceae bacterium]|nr:methyltransferase [Gaiellaceae bacterium]